MGKTSIAQIMIVDDHPLVREGLSCRIASTLDMAVCCEAASQKEAITQLDQFHPDLMIIDISLQTGHGIDLIKHVKSKYPWIKMLVVSGFQESLYGERSLRAGASGYMNKQDSNEQLLDAIRCVLRGEIYARPETTQRLPASTAESDAPAKSGVELLTVRELEVFRMIGQGMTTGAIASKLFLSVHTIDTYREKLKKKLGAANAGELSRQAVQWVLENA